MRPGYTTARDETSETEQRPPSSAQARLDAQNQAQWTAWANGVNERLAAVDTFFVTIMGGEDKDKDPGVLLQLDRQAYEDTRAAIAQAVKKMSDALNARIEAEIATLHDEFVEKIDKSIVAAAPKKLRAIADDILAIRASVRDSLSEQADATSALLDKLAERIDRVDAKRRSDRNSWHKEKAEVAEQLTTVLGGMLDKVNTRLDKQAAEIKEIEEALREFFAEPASRRRLLS
jgi:hypothetical protein